MNNIKEILHTLIRYYDTTRQCGHTTAMIQGAQNSDCLVMTHTMHMGENIKKKFKNTKITTITPYNMDNQLRGVRKPLLLDNSVLYTIFWDCLAEIIRLENLNPYNMMEPTKRKKKKCK